MADEKKRVEEAQREQQEKNRARSTGSMKDYTPINSYPEPEATAEQGEPLPNYIFFDGQQELATMLVNDIAPDLEQTHSATISTAEGQYTLFEEPATADELGAQVSGLADAFELRVKNIDEERAAKHFKAQDQIQGNPPGTEEAIFRKTQEHLLQTISTLRDFVQSPDFKRLAASFSDFTEWIKGTNPQRTMADFLYLGSIIDTYKPLFPFILAEVEEIKQTPGMESISLTEFMRNIDEQGNHIQSHFERSLQKAIERKELTEQQAEIIEQLPLVQSIAPSKHTMPNNALMNTLQQKPAINAGPFDMVVSKGKGKRKEITAYTMIEFDPGDTSITITKPNLTEHERQVSDALVSLWIEAEKENLPPIFTPDMIFRAMPGGGDKASPQQKGAITKTIEKFRRLHITVDATEEMRIRKKIPDNATLKFDDFYLSVTHAEYKVKNGGQTVNAYKVNAEPIILTYSKMTNQLLTVPAQYIAIEKVKNGIASDELLPMTEQRQAMTGYLLRRIAIMKHDKKNKVQLQSNVIKFDTLFSETGTSTTDRKQTMLNRNFCFDVLDFWKVSGFIKNYRKQEKGRSVTGIIIDI